MARGLLGWCFPAAAERLDQVDAGDQATAEHGELGALVRERSCLHDDDGEIGDDARPILVVRDRHRVARRLDRGALHLGLLFEDALGGEVVLHVAERPEHRLPVIGDGLLVGRGRLRFRRFPQSAVEDELRERDAAREADVDAAAREEARRRIERRLRDADLRIGRGHAAFRRGDVRAPDQQFGRQRRGYRRDLHARDRGGDAEIGRRLADEDRDRMLELRPVQVRLERLRPRRHELGFRLHDVAAGDDAGVVLVSRELQRTLVSRHAVLQEPGLGILHAQQEVALRELRLQRERGRGEVVGGRFGGGLARFDAAPDAAPQVDLPARGEADFLVGAGGIER